MKIFKQIGLILLFYVIGEALSYLILLLLPHFFIPGPILGMVLLLLVMSIRWIQLKDVDEVGTFLTSNMHSSLFRLLFRCLNTLMSFLLSYGKLPLSF
jgi:holin-like protein